MTDISLEAVTGKLNRVGYDAFLQALRHAKTAGNRNVELAHWLFHLQRRPACDISLTLDHYSIDRSKFEADLTRVITGFKAGATEMPGISTPIIDLLDRGWHYATLFFGETQIRSGHLLLAALKSVESRRALTNVSPEFAKVTADALATDFRKIWATSEEENLRPMDNSGLIAGEPGQELQKGTTALNRYSQDLTAKARSGQMDPVLGRESEIRQLIDVLMRRRQNNPILTGEAGVGKTAVVEGFAQRIAAGDVPPPLRAIRLCALDIGLMQAGASMKGEFEQRLRSVIDEVQSSPTPVVLFIDEAHTLIGAGGAAGTGDAANLLKPALARGSLRTIAATTWNEYRQYIEKDPALTRRFQAIHIDEPDVERCCDMLRGMLGPMEKHHGVRVSVAAVKAAVHLSQRYIPARQLPDKAVSLLDTACARVAISQSGTPARVEDTEQSVSALRRELAALVEEQKLTNRVEPHIDDLRREIESHEVELAAVSAEWEAEKANVVEIRRLQAAISGADDPALLTDLRTQLATRFEQLEAGHHLIYAEVDEQAVASVVSEWTGIPVGRMVKDEIEVILSLETILGERVIGQSHGLEMIAKRIRTSRAKLDNPNKPIGVFLLCGPSGVGKTETALTLADALYGGEQNIITINMSEFQEAHSVSTLKGAPPGYVGFGEGGRLTEAVRRKPYSVVLLDEIEKAHPDVHEIFFQVFDRGQMEDGSGRRIDFRNTLFILTSNVGTDVIATSARDPLYRNEPETLAKALKPELLKVFPPALLGRLVVIPYYPLSDTMLESIVRLHLGRIGRRIEASHGVAFSYDGGVVEHILSLCNDPDAGGRMIDNILTNTMLPGLSRELLKHTIKGTKLTSASVGVTNEQFVYNLQEAPGTSSELATVEA